LAFFCRGVAVVRKYVVPGMRRVAMNYHRASSAGIALDLDLVPQLVALWQPSAQRRRRNSWNLWTPGAFCAVLPVPGTGRRARTAGCLSLDMQHETDGLLTHTFAVQSNHFVVPINQALRRSSRSCSGRLLASEHCQPMGRRFGITGTIAFARAVRFCSRTRSTAEVRLQSRWKRSAT